MLTSRRDIDFNGHINNSAYLIWALDTLPADLRPAGDMVRYRINFRRESHAGEQMQIAHFISGNCSHHLITCEGETRAEIVIFWK